MLCRIIEYPAKSTSPEFIYGTRTAEFLGKRIPSILISSKKSWKKAVSSENNLFVQNRSTNVQNMETWQKKNNFFTEHLPLVDSPINVYFVLELKKVDMRLKKKKMKFYKETLKETLIILHKTKNK